MRETNSLKAIEAIQESDLIPQEDVSIQSKAYIFLRRVDNHLQMREEQQSHTIPSKIEEQKYLARCIDFDKCDTELARQQFLGQLKKSMERVRVIFSTLFSSRNHAIEAALRNSSRIQNFRESEQKLLHSLSLNLTPYINQKNDKSFQGLFETIGSKFHLYQPLLDRPFSISRLARIA